MYFMYVINFSCQKTHIYFINENIKPTSISVIYKDKHFYKTGLLTPVLIPPVYYISKYCYSLFI